MQDQDNRSASAAELEEFLLKTHLFRGCDRTVVNKVVPRVEVLDFAARAPIVRAGTPADGVYVLYSGRASAVLVHATTGATSTLEVLQTGDHFGEVGLLTKAANPQSVMADDACVVLCLRAELVDALLNKVPAFGISVARRLAMRTVSLGVMALKSSGASHAASAPTSPLRAPTPVFGHPPTRPTAVTAPMGPVKTEAKPEGGGIVFVEVSEFDPPSKTLGMVPVKIILQHRLIPLRLNGNSLLVGMVLPRNTAALTDLRRVLHTVDFEVAAISLEDFAQTVTRLKLDTGRLSESRDQPAINPDSLVFDVNDAEREAEKSVRVVGDEVVRLVNRIVAGAITRDASDVHIEPEPTGVKVRYRVQGMLQEWNEVIPPSFGRGLVARLKILAGLDITDRRLPQDGRIGLMAGSREIDLRISTLPSSRGEKVVLRVFEGSGMMRPLDQIYAEPGALAAVRKALQRPHGAIIVAGATGSGKSSSMYSMLHERRKSRPDTNVMLIEDPIEYRLQGVTQVQVNANIGLGFPQVLRAALRQDPDVIAVGETRDAETAHMALEAAMTGHLVLTSMHANDVGTVLQRLESLGCSKTLIAESLSFVVVQRLARKLCQSCVRVDPPPPALTENLVARKLVERGSNIALPRPVGCEACGQTGYAGRLPVIEWWQVQESARDAVIAGQSSMELLRAAGEAQAFQSFAGYASYLMARKLLGTSEALMAVAG